MLKLKSLAKKTKKPSTSRKVKKALMFGGQHDIYRPAPARKNPAPRKNPAGPTDAQIIAAAKVIAKIPASIRPKNAWPAQYLDVVEAWKRAQARMPWIKENLNRIQSGVPARNMEKALELVPWENTVEDWERLMEYRIAKRLRKKAGCRTVKMNPMPLKVGKGWHIHITLNNGKEGFYRSQGGKTNFVQSNPTLFKTVVAAHKKMNELIREYPQVKRVESEMSLGYVTRFA